MSIYKLSINWNKSFNWSCFY